MLVKKRVGWGGGGGGGVGGGGARKTLRPKENVGEDANRNFKGILFEENTYIIPGKITMDISECPLNFNGAPGYIHGNLTGVLHFERTLTDVCHVTSSDIFILGRIYNALLHRTEPKPDFSSHPLIVSIPVFDT